jgi:hypothetical protein
MPAISFPRLRQWRRYVRFCDSLLVLCRVHVGVALENLSETLGPTASSGRSRKKPRPVQLEINALEERAFPGQTVGMLGWGLIGTGLSLIDRSLAEPPSIQGRGLGDLGDATGKSALHSRTTDSAPGASATRIDWAPLDADAARFSGERAPASLSPPLPVSPSRSPDSTTPGAAEQPFANVLAGPLFDALSGDPLRGPKPPTPIVNDGLPRSKWNDGYGGNNGTSSSGYADTRNGQTSPMPPNTTFNLDGSPQAPSSSSSLTRLKAQSSPVATPPSIKAPGTPIVPTSGPTVPKQPPVIGPTLPSQLPTGPGRAQANIAAVDGNGNLSGGSSAGIDATQFDMPSSSPARSDQLPFPAIPPVIDAVLGKPTALGTSLGQVAATAGTPDPQTGNLTVTAGGDIPSYSSHLTNVSQNGPSLPDASALLQDAAATNPARALVYSSNSVNVQPIVQLAILSSTTDQFQAALTWNGSTQSTVTFSAGFRMSVIDLQVATPVSASGLYPFDVQVSAYSGGVLQGDGPWDPSGVLPVIVNGSSSPVSYGWQMGVDQLIPVSSGVIWAYGSGGRWSSPNPPSPS